MENIINIICKKTELIESLEPIVKTEFFKYTENSYKFFRESLCQKIKPFVDEAYFVIEYPYVDKIYRDSYYNYFASKYNSTKRDCIRISIFKGLIEKKDFRNNDYSKNDIFFNRYQGFFIIRPTNPNFFGRSVINPSILKNKDFSICTSTFKSTVLCNKFKIKGFPHSSQDTETISCAETTLWALMEYFSSKYQDYTPVLPSKILNVLDSMSIERQLPSKGLDVTKLSFALKKFNFGSIIYASDSYVDRFQNLLSCYTNSGIPLILAIQNYNLGHALLNIGAENLKENHINTLTPTNFITGRLKNETIKKKLNFYDLDDCKKKFVFIDDNYSPYQLSLLNEPTAYYNNPDWLNTKITHFIVPLYSKIYLEAFKAKNYIYSHLIRDLSPLLAHSDYYLKIFLASSRSYKDFLAKNGTFSDDIKEIILEKTMPKFIWVCEISNKDLIKENKANGIVIIDATEPNIAETKPLIYSGYNDIQILFNEKLNKFQKITLILQPFKMFNGNLETFYN